MRPLVELPLVKKIPIVYPESDGEPMGETEWHVFLSLRLIHALRERFRDRPDVHVGGNLFIYFGEGDPTDVICPDVFVAFGARPGLRRVWKTWEEGGLFPQVIFEAVSDDSRRRDLVTKRGFYDAMGVRDYFVIDPTREILETPLRGWRRKDDALVAIDPEAGVPRRLRSEALGLFVEEDETYGVRLIDQTTGRPLLFPEEEAEARRTEAEARRTEAEARRAEAEARRAAEAETERLRAELELLRRGR